MALAVQQLRCPDCGAYLDGGERDTYACKFCGTVTPHAALVQQPRAPFPDRIDRLWKAVGADFDRDGWFEICGWHEHVLYAVHLIDRALMWQLGGFADDHDLFAGPGRVYVSTDAELTAINACAGVRVWALALMNVREVKDPGYVPNGAIWARTHEDKLVTIDRATGARRGSTTAYDSAGTFRTIVGHRLVVSSVGCRILDAAQSAPGLDLGTGVETAMKDLEAGRALSRVPTSIDSAIVHRGVLYAVVDESGSSLDAYRVADGRLVARRKLAGRGERLLGAVAGHPISGNETTLRREPDGPGWAVTGDDNPQIKTAHGVGGVLVVHVTRDGPGADRHSLTGLDAASLAFLWQVDDLGYLMSDIVCTDERIVFAITRKLVAMDPASGAKLWETPVPDEQGLQVGGGLVIQTRYGVTLLADTGEMLFPKDARASTPASPPVASAPDELPTWGVEGASPPKASTGDSKVVWIALVIVAIVGAIIAFTVT
ncbi:MAG: PQQ-binding-like beta-propeller repeat protein [Proteobacteria bacterium]|nr:PQQ-binding-like beta-propeller repeat protein [Pseudomonadota bacterium]